MNYWELFDLKSDPQEMTSVFGKPEYAAVQAELEKELARLRTELKVPEQDPIEADTRANAPQQPRRRVNPNGPAASG
jgi:hypothetical protein